MTVETFYFCSDLDLVQNLWEQPIERTLLDLANLKIDQAASHWGLVDKNIIKNVAIPKINSIASAHKDKISLSEISKATIELAASPIKPGVLNLLPNHRRKIMEIRFGEIAQLADIYTGLILAARQGPANEPLETRAVDQYLSKWLEKYIPATDAQSFDGSIIKQSQHCYPPEFKMLKKEFTRDLEMYVPIPYLMRADEWKQRIGMINKSPIIWKSLLNDADFFSESKNKPNMKSYNRHTPIYNAIIRKYLAEMNFTPPKKAEDEFLMLGQIQPASNERVITYIKEILKISQYSMDNSLGFLKIMYM